MRPSTAWWCPECGLGRLRAPDNTEGTPARCQRCLGAMRRAVVFPERRQAPLRPYAGTERRAELPI